MNEEDIRLKTLECLSCVTKPCQVGCPLNNDTTGFIKLAREGKYEEAYHLLLETTVLPSVCGRICPHDKQCQGMCVKKVSFESVKTFLNCSKLKPLGLLSAISKLGLAIYPPEPKVDCSSSF